MIGLSINVENMAPLITINGESYSNSIHNHPTVEALHPNEPNNNNNNNNNNHNIEPVIESSATDVYCQHPDQINGNVFCVSDNRVNLDDVPISALRSKSRDLLSKRLNDIKVILSEDGAPRDWRGILSSIGLSDDINLVQSKPNPMKEVLDRWENECKIRPTIGNLQQILGHIDRWDVLDDTNDCFVEDSNNYWDMVSKSKESKGVNNQAKPGQLYNEYPVSDESNLLTRDDIARRKQNLPPQHYDAYLLFDEDDINFATQVLDKLETEYGLKLCSKERDLIGGTIESDAVMRMISERCNRLVVIFSKAFLDSESNSFLVKFAQAFAIEKRMRKIIPIIYEECELPPAMSMYYKLFYRHNETSPSPYFNFWMRLYDSIQCVPNYTASLTAVPEITITTIDSPSPVPSIESGQQAELAVIDFETPHTLSSKNKRKDKSKSPESSSPTTPTSFNRRWVPKFGSQSTRSKSMLTLDATDQLVDKENERCHSSLSLSNSISSPTPTNSKKSKKFFSLKKLFSPASAQKLSAESDSSNGGGEKTTKKKSTSFHKRLHRRSKTREPIADC